MHEVLRSHKQIPTQKFHQNFINFEKPQNLGFKTWKCMKKRDSKLTKWRKTGKSLKKPWGRSLEWVREVWEERTENYRERDREKWKLDRDGPLYRMLVNLDKYRCWEVSSHLSRKVSRKTTSTDATVKKVSRYKAKTQEKKLDRSISCQEAIEDPGTFLIDPPSCWGSVEIAIRNSLRAQQIARCRGSVETT